jgi:hypothetical protein
MGIVVVIVPVAAPFEGMAIEKCPGIFLNAVSRLNDGKAWL